MPTDTIIVVSVVVAAFAIFSVTLSFGILTSSK